MIPAEMRFTTSELAQRFPVTLRQLQWWDERVVVSPHREKYRRTYPLKDALVIGVASQLRERGVSLGRVRRLLPFLQESLTLDTRYVAWSEQESAVATQEEAEVIQFCLRHTGCLLVDVQEIVRRLRVN